MLRLLKILWPALIPLLVYVLWCVWRARKKAKGEEVPPLTKHLFLTLVATLVIGALCFILLGAEQSHNEGHDYVPAHMENGTLVPGGFKE